MTEKKRIRLIALDLDGTLFTGQGKISAEDQRAIREAIAAGITVVIATGRPYIGLPFSDMDRLGIQYAITTNGAAIYRKEQEKRICLKETCMEWPLVAEILQKLSEKRIHYDIFIHGDAYSEKRFLNGIDLLEMPASLRRYIRDTRCRVDSLPAFLREKQENVQKITLNFYPAGDGTYVDRDWAVELLSGYPEISFLTGGYHNLEFTKAGVKKGPGLRFLTDSLGIPVEEAMAVGDTENDLDIIETAGLGVAMGNAQESVKQMADYITHTNEESGVAWAIRGKVLI